MFIGRIPRRKKNRNFTFNLNALENLEPRHLLAGDLVAHWVADEQVATSEDGAITEWKDVVGNITALVNGSPTLLR